MQMIAVNSNSRLLSIGHINPFRYRGYYYDVETGFYYLQTRYYDPTICRFINADDYELVADLASSMQLNMYAYCGNNPVMYTDETGEIVWISAIIGGIIGATFGGISAYISGENVWAGILIGGLTGALSGLLPQKGWVSGMLAFANSLANSIYNDRGFQDEHLRESFASALLAGFLFNLKIEVLGVIDSDVLKEVSDGIIQNTLGLLAESMLANLTIRTSVDIVHSGQINNISKFYIVQYRGV